MKSLLRYVFIQKKTLGVCMKVIVRSQIANWRILVQWILLQESRDYADDTFGVVEVVQNLRIDWLGWAERANIKE